MSLLNTIRQDQLASRKEGDKTRSTLLTTLLGEAAMVGKNDGNRETTDSEVIQIVKKFIKNIDETLKAMMDLDNLVLTNDSVLTTEREILESYLPKQLDEQGIKDAVAAIVATLHEKSPKMMGVVMKELKSKYDGQYDGKVASQIVKESLS